jgi:hypothetical protein
MKELELVREEFGFKRTACACAFCQVHCRHMPGTLTPSDLARLCPEGQDLLAWAEVHLRALTESPYPALVPARGGQGACHWFFEGRCAVHARAPYGCAFFDSHMSDEEIARRVAATVEAIRQDAAAAGPYLRVWRHLCGRGLVAPRGDRDAVAREMDLLRRQARSSRRRVEGA